MPSSALRSRSPPSYLPCAMTTKSPPNSPDAYVSPLQYSNLSRTRTIPSNDHSNRASVSASAVPSLVSDSESSRSSRHSDSGLSDSDPLETLDIQLSHRMHSDAMDRGLASQAQMSGKLHAKQQELADLQAYAQRRLKSARMTFAEGQKMTKEIQRDLEWTQKHVSDLKIKTERKYPREYRKTHKRHALPDN